MQYVLELACQADNIRNIELGRMAVLAMPHDWVVQHIERYAEPFLTLGAKWEYCRLGEM